LVTGEGVRRADVGLCGEQIGAIGPDLPSGDAQEVIDVSGRYVLPGIIDAHLHPVYVDDVADCSRAGAFGGVTTLLHFVSVHRGESVEEKVAAMRADGQARSTLDFGLHASLFDAERQIEEIPRVMGLGVRTFKFFLAYVKQGWHTSDYQLLRAMDLLAQHGGLAMIHGENGGAVDYLEDTILARPGASALDYGRSRPDVLEEEAVFRAIRLAELVACPLYVAHVTARRTLPHIQRAQAEGQAVFAETCSHYLTLTDEILAERGALAKIGPPLRAEDDRLALWKAVRDGVLHVVSTDHAPKRRDLAQDFLSQPFGAPDVETLLPLTHDEGVNRGRISLVRMVQVLCENPARIFGLYPRKGTIAVGSDADIVIFDPARPFTIRASNQHSNAGYTLYEGRPVLGWPEMSFQRGRPVLWRGDIVAEPGQGEYLNTLEHRTSPLGPATT
jgi:dihydropyrimidinase